MRGEAEREGASEPGCRRWGWRTRSQVLTRGSAWVSPGMVFRLLSELGRPCALRREPPASPSEQRAQVQGTIAPPSGGPLPARTGAVLRSPEGAGQDPHTTGGLLLELFCSHPVPGTHRRPRPATAPQIAAAPLVCLQITRQPSRHQSAHPPQSGSSLSALVLLASLAVISTAPSPYLTNPCRAPRPLLRLRDTKGTGPSPFSWTWHLRGEDRL